MSVMIDISLLLTLYISSSLSAVIKPFDFQCYTHGICRFPHQFCSSEEHLQRCMPCSIRVCEVDTPPLQCSYNCSMRLQEKAGLAGDSLDVKESQAATDPSHDYFSSEGWKIAFLVETIVIVTCIGVACVAFCIRRWQLSSRTEKTPADQREPLVDRINQNGIHANNNNNEVRAELSNPPVMAEQIGSNRYRPTTNLTRMDSTRSH